MKMDGLRAILDKDEIVPTRIARDFLDHPQEVDDLYKHHVRTYIPLRTGSDEASGVNDFSKKFVRQVKEARSPRGYITADFGYGKTSAGLFVWQQAQEARLVAVPPFKLNRLEDLLDATAGWIAYILQKTTPTLVERVNDTYRFYHDRELESITQRYGVTLEQAQRMYQDQALQLNITPKDIVRFFVQMTDIVLDAGFEGLVVIPDELQQYLEPEIKSGKVDPLVPLFDIVSDLMDHQGKLAFGFLLIITSKELGVINDQRGDLIDRMRGNTLDLRAIYDRQFPARLWSRFAETFEFQDLASQVVDNFTLESLGEIASRQDLSNGPRTVINAFRRIARRVIESEGTAQPYSPIDLVNDFLNNNIAFDARKLLQEATNRALSSSVVNGRPELEQAVKLLAAFPSDGAKREVQEQYLLQEACSQLKSVGSPEIVIEVGDRHHPALALRGLDQARENTDELTLILGEFIRNYEPHAANQVERAVNAFVRLLINLVFKNENWTPNHIEQRRFMQHADLLFEGAFPDMVRRFPERQVYVRVLGDDEIPIERKSNAECTLTFVLNRHFEMSSVERQSILGSLQLDEAQYDAVFHLNLMLPCFDGLNRLTQDQLRRVVDVEEVNVLMILALHEFLQNAAERDGVSKTLKDMIQRSMSIRLLEASLETLLNPAVGSVFGVAGSRIVENVVGALIEARYGDQYQTLITYKQWRDRLRDYISALNQLPSFAQKQGYAAVEGKKDEIAKYFGTTAASFDAFQSRFSDLIQIETPFSRAKAGSVRFTRHELEETIFASLEESATTVKRNGEIRKALRLEDIYGGASEMGYREDEVKYILQIMEARDLIETSAEWVAEKPRPDVAPRKIRARILEFKRQSETLAKANQQPDAKQMLARAEQYLNRFEALDEHENEIELIILAEQVEADIELLSTVIDREIELIRGKMASLKVDAFDPADADVLGQMIHAGAFTTAINQIRTRYEQSLMQWRNAAANYRESLTELKRDADKLSLQDLQHARERVAQLTQKHLDLNDHRRQLSKAIERTKSWNELARMIHDVLTAVQRLGNPGEPLLQELQRIENSIVDAFRKDSEETLAHSSHYQEQIQKLEKKLNQFASRAEREFNQLQDTYREMFIRYANITNNNLWQRIFYSANNVEGVYTNLHEAVQGQTVTLLENLFQEIEQRRDDILSLVTISDDGRSVSNDIVGNLQQQVDSLDDEYTHLTDQIDQSTIQDPQKLQKWLESFAKVFRQLTNLKAEIQNLREPSNEQLFSPDEQALLDVIAKRGASGSLVRARQELNNLDDEMFWQLLRELWEKRIIEIIVKNLD